MTTPELEVLLPVHNEADSIQATIQEIYDQISPQVLMRFIICEDGSIDDTKNILRALAASIPMNLLLSDARKGYSRAVRDGMLALEAPYLLCLDSDGQCDPKDFDAFWASRNDVDVVLGWRVDRADNWMRKLMSRTFYRFYRLLYGVPVHDPSCPYVLSRKKVVEQLVHELGAMQQGFWWEYVARAHRRGFTIRELPVHHRQRSAGTTQVYKLSRIPGIGWRHFLALFTILKQTRLPKTRHRPD